MTTLQEQILIVAEARNKAEVKFQARHSALTAWQEAHKDLYDEEGTANLEQTRAEQTLRDMTIEVYKATGNKTPAKGVQVRIFQKLDYNQEDAKSWCLEHRLALKVDVPNFEKIAKTENLPFVTIIDEPRAQIATNLDLTS